MSLDPLTTSQRITDNYRNYLRSSFSPRQPLLAREFEQALAHTFRLTRGPYVGETKATQVEAEDDFRARYPNEERQDNELISREVMRDQPPHILLINYAMLEYLLLRPEDSTLFDGPTSEHWRFMVLDEAHVYNGAQGTEVAMLLRRLRDRVIESRPGVLRCFATSATLGRGRADYPELIEFAESLFAEAFEWDDQDSADRARAGLHRARRHRRPCVHRAVRPR